jgi:anthranilate synthase/phosphoribosyltransferase
MYVIIDNYDSFTYNLFQYLSALTASEVRVFRNDRVTVAQLEELQPQGIVISPGPGRPEDAGISIEAVRHFAGRVPLLGVCLGHQAIGHAFGASIVGAGRIVHGKTDRISLDGRGLFRGVPSPSVFTRYHSLVVQRDTLPKEFEVTANAPDGEVMGIRHRKWIVEGVQFHPESIASETGMRILANFLDYRREPFTFRPLLERVMSGGSLSMEAAAELMDEVTEGRLPASQLSAMLVALGIKGYTAEEIAGFASVLARKKQRLEHRGVVVDTCGTGGDGLATFNISSLAALVVASCGTRVAKHGNRGVSSPTGSADFFAALGVDSGLTPRQAAALLETTGFAFLFAPTYHGAMRHAAAVRAELGIKTVLNLLGPLVNPAEAEYQLIGVYDRALCEPVARAARLLGVRRVLVVHGCDGQDEISVTGPTLTVEIGEDDQCHERVFELATCDLAAASLEELKGGSAADNAALARELLAGGGPAALRDAVALNAGAALYVCGAAPDIAAGYRRARTALEGGAAAAKLEQVVATAGALLAEAEPQPGGGVAPEPDRPRASVAAAAAGAAARDVAPGPRLR